MNNVVTKYYEEVLRKQEEALQQKAEEKRQERLNWLKYEISLQKVWLKESRPLTSIINHEERKTLKERVESRKNRGLNLLNMTK